MAKKKNTKKPVSKRTTRATLDERNERLGKTDASKTRKPRSKKPEVVVTTEPAINTVFVNRSVEDIINDPFVVSEVEKIIPPAPSCYISYPDRKVEYTKVNKNVVYSAWEWINFKLDDAKVYWKKNDPITAINQFAFAHPLIFGIGFVAVVGTVALGVAVAFRYLRW
jgi:hypothetical protein